MVSSTTTAAEVKRMGERLRRRRAITLVIGEARRPAPRTRRALTMPRWRTATWAFLIFNVVMVGLVLAVGGIADSQTNPGGGFVVAMLRMTAVVIVWPIGLVTIGIAWVKGRRGGR
jgi:hypothetical protein